MKRFLIYVSFGIGIYFIVKITKKILKMDEPLAFEKNIPNNKDLFISKVKDVAEKLNINPNWLMFVMNNESGLKSDIENTSFPFKNGYATGLIQFTPDTATYLGTSTAKLKAMENYNQLDYVYKYLSPFRGKLNGVVDVYNAVFFPVAVGKNDDFILQAKNLSAYIIAKNNPIFDLNKDGKISVGEIKNFINNKLKKQNIKL